MPTGEEATEANVECVKDQILVSLPKEESTDGGLIISNVEKDKRPNCGQVVKGRPRAPGREWQVHGPPGETRKSRQIS